MRRAVLGFYTYVEFGLCTAVFLPAMGIAWMLHRGDPTQRVPGQWMRRFGRTTSRLTPLWRFSVEGDAPRDIGKQAYVVIANHESTADPFLLSFVPWDMRWIAKEEIYKLPILGWLMKFGGDIPVRRGSADSVREMMAMALETLAAGQSVMIFPEGTRSCDGAMLPFKDGAFQLAIDAQVPILPIALGGTRTCRPKGSSWFGDSEAIAQVLTPIPTAGMTAADVPRLRERARAHIDAALPALRAKLGLEEPELVRATDPSPAAQNQVNVSGASYPVSGTAASGS